MPTGDHAARTFLVDTGADHTVLSAELLRDSGIHSVPATRQLGGVGGLVESVQVHPQIELMKQDGEWITIANDCFALTADNAIDLPVLGRDIRNIFSSVVDREGDTVCLVRGRHRYVIQEA